MTTAEIDQLVERWRQAQRGKVVLLDPLPRRARLCLAWARFFNGIGCRLAKHDHFRAAMAVFRVAGLWD